MPFKAAVEGPHLLPRAIQLLIGILRRKGTPVALREAEELEGKLSRLRGAVDERRRAALEEAKGMALQGMQGKGGDRRARRRGRKRGKGKGRQEGAV
jgi:hypothetical protein